MPTTCKCNCIELFNTFHVVSCIIATWHNACYIVGVSACHNAQFMCIISLLCESACHRTRLNNIITLHTHSSVFMRTLPTTVVCACLCIWTKMKPHDVKIKHGLHITPHYQHNNNYEHKCTPVCSPKSPHCLYTYSKRISCLNECQIHLVGCVCFNVMIQ